MLNTPQSFENEAEPLEKLPAKTYPVLPVRDTVLFPHAVLPLTVGRESSIQLIESLGDQRTIVVVDVYKRQAYLQLLQRLQFLTRPVRVLKSVPRESMRRLEAQ